MDSEKLLNFYQNQKFSEAANYLLQIYPRDKEDIKLLVQIAYFKNMAGETQESEKYYLRANALEPSNLQILISLARINAKRENYPQARVYLKQYLQKDSLNFSVYKQIAGYVGPSEVPLKFGYLSKANNLNPRDSEVANDLAEAYYKQKKFAHAYEILKIAMEADTGNLTLLKTNLRVCYADRRLEEAVITGEKLIALGDSSTAVLSGLGKTCYALKQYNKALKIFKYIPEPDRAEVTLYYITLCYKQLKNYPKAIEHANLTINDAISPYVASYYMLLGALHENNKQITSAIKAYKKGLQFRDHGEIYYSLGLLYEQELKNNKQALAYYKLYLTSNVDKEKNSEELVYVKKRVEELKKQAI